MIENIEPLAYGDQTVNMTKSWTPYEPVVVLLPNEQLDLPNFKTDEEWKHWYQNSVMGYPGLSVDKYIYQYPELTREEIKDGICNKDELQFLQEVFHIYKHLEFEDQQTVLQMPEDFVLSFSNQDVQPVEQENRLDYKAAYFNFEIPWIMSDIGFYPVPGGHFEAKNDTRIINMKYLSYLLMRQMHVSGDLSIRGLYTVAGHYLYKYFFNTKVNGTLSSFNPVDVLKGEYYYSVMYRHGYLIGGQSYARTDYFLIDDTDERFDRASANIGAYFRGLKDD